MPAPRRSRGDNGSNPTKKLPVYDVFRLEAEGGDDVEHIIRRGVAAKDQGTACDIVVESLPASARTGHFGAYLHNGRKVFPYDVETTTVTKRGDAIDGPAPVAEPAP